MGNELADAIRTELRAALLAVYGTLEAAAKALDMPYKTLYRHLTPSGKDRTARVTLDFVIEVSNHLARVSNVDFSEILRRARLAEDDGNVSEVDEDVKPNFNYALAAKKGTPLVDQAPHAE